MRDTRVKQIGWHGQCARKGCGKNAQYRVILSGWDVQAYVCTSDIAWGVNLDLITHSSAEAMGWEMRNPSRGGSLVDPLMGPIKRADFGRDVASQVASEWPVMREVKPGIIIPTFSPE